MAADVKPTQQEYGRIGARKRWSGHEPRTVRLDSLDPDTARLIRALLAQQREATPANDHAEVATEVRRALRVERPPTA
jgi:hypothetical protein